MEGMFFAVSVIGALTECGDLERGGRGRRLASRGGRAGGGREGGRGLLSAKRLSRT